MIVKMKNYCRFCDQEIPLNKTYCSDSCRKKYSYHSNKVKKLCKGCKTLFTGTANTYYCSIECRLKHQKKAFKTCPMCGKRFKGRWDKKYCSKECYRLANDNTKGFEKASCSVCGAIYRRKKNSNVFTCRDSCASKMLTLASNKILLELFNTHDIVVIRKKVSKALEKNT